MSTDSGKLIEVIYPLLVFRNEAAFTVPKAVRERGYIQSLDLQVSSVDWNIYENSKALPNIQFYGYVQLVMQDACTIEVPIKYPRQRIWHIRIEDALSQWRDIHTWHNGSLEWFEWFFRFFTQGEEEAPPLPPIEYPDTNFVESPLREVFVQVQDNCQFEIELTQWEPVSFTGRNAKTYDGKSRQVDGDKDGGLPSGGIQPRKNPSSDPFKGNRNPSTLSFENGFFASIDKLDRTIDEYVPLEPQFEGGQCEGILYWVNVTGYIRRTSTGISQYQQSLGSPLRRLRSGKIFSVDPLIVLDTNGSPVASVVITNGNPVSVDNVFIAGFEDIVENVVTGVTVERFDGGVDNCGSIQVGDPTQL